MDVIRDAGFRWASLATAERVIRLPKTDAAVFGDDGREMARLQAAKVWTVGGVEARVS